MKARIWLTGFEPFGEHVENPSKILVERILGTSQTHEIKEIPPYGLESESVELSFSGRILTVDEAGSSSSLNDLSDVDAVIHVGLNENAEKIRFEMCAINELNFRIADNSGRETKEDFIDENGLPLLHTTVHRPSISHVFSNNEFAPRTTLFDDPTDLNIAECPRIKLLDPILYPFELLAGDAIILLPIMVLKLP